MDITFRYGRKVGGFDSSMGYKMKMKSTSLIELCGDIITFLKINRINNTITSVDNAELDSRIQEWSDQFKELNHD